MFFSQSADDLRSNFICENCKDSTVQFFVFKKGVVEQMNLHKRMILAQIGDFLKQCNHFEDIQVIRKLHSITLQIDSVLSSQPVQNIVQSEESVEDEPEDNEASFEEILSEAEEEERVEVEIPSPLPSPKNEEDVVVMVVSCSKCDEVATSSESLEVHEFLRHSTIGIHVEREVEQSKFIVRVSGESGTRLIDRCSSCSLEFEDRSLHILHIVAKHSWEIMESVNEVFAIDSTTVDQKAINTYLEFVGELLIDENTNETPTVNENIKQYFYEIYSGDAVKSEIVETAAIDSDDGNQEKSVEAHHSKRWKVSNRKSIKEMTNMSEASRKWVRKEISLRKKMVRNTNGVMRPIYQCIYCKQHSSNSASGFRYHLVSKHLNDRNLDNLHELDQPCTDVESFAYRTKNICYVCCLKFKDQKLLLAHQACHDLLSVISECYLFPSCSTCSALFIDEITLNLHLANHENDLDVLQPISVPHGEIMLLGKMIHNMEPKDHQTSIEGFAWSCGHCSLKFSKEVFCRFHLLMFHAQSFECPVDKRNFSGFKSVSLFCHHLRNKHSEYFPDLSFPCTFCKLEFSSVYDKLSHMKGCSLKKFSCDHCGKKFFKKSELVSHLKFVSGELTFPCNACNKKCETLSDLKIHMRSHTKEVSGKSSH